MASDPMVNEVAQSSPTLCDPMDCSLPGSSVCGIFQARVLEWVAISFSRRSSQPRDQTQVSFIAGRRFTIWATREDYGPITSWQIDGETVEMVTEFIWGEGAPKSLQMVTAAMKLNDACPLEEIEKQRSYFINKGPSSQSYGFSSSHVWVWKLDYKESWALMLLNCGVGEDSWESLGLQRDPTSPSERKSVVNIQWKDWCWSWSSNSLANWCKDLTP